MRVETQFVEAVLPEIKMAMMEEIHDGDVHRELMVLPGFRFYPTEEELLGFYLKKMVQCGHPLKFDKIIPTLDLYRYDPWELPGLAHDVGERQWFFFVPRVQGKSCTRPNRLTVSGFWKATGSDRAIRNDLLQCIGLKKTLVFYKGKAIGGQRTDWIMNEYRLPDLSSSATKKKMDMVLCRIYRKAVSRKSIEQWAKPNHVQNQDPVLSAGHEYEQKVCNSFSHNGSFQLSNPIRETGDSSLHHQNQPGVCSFDRNKTNDQDNLFEYLEQISMLGEETTVLKTTQAYKPQHLELPTLPMDCLFIHDAIPSPWADIINARTPSALLSTP